MTTTHHYHPSGASLGESYSGGTLGGFNVTNTYDALMRRQSLTVRNGTTVQGATITSSREYRYTQTSPASVIIRYPQPHNA